MLRVIDFYWMFYVKNDGFLLNFKLIDLKIILIRFLIKFQSKKLKNIQNFKNWLKNFKNSQKLHQIPLKNH